MRYLFIIILFLMSYNSSAQMKSSFKVLPDEEDTGGIYQGYCSWPDILKLPAFADMGNDHNFFNDTTSLAFLKEHLVKYDIIVFMGTWCSDSRDLLPPFYELVKKTGYPEDSIMLIVLDRNKKAEDHIEEKYAISNVPTFILIKDGKEVGRITEQVQVDMEQDLINLIKADLQ